METLFESPAAAGLGFACSIIFTWIARRRYRPLKISKLYIYPIKSCKGIEVKSALVTPRGFYMDREFMICDEDGKFVSQRKYPQMALISVQFNENEGVLVVNAPGMQTLIVPTSYPSQHAMNMVNMEVTPMTVWGDKCEGIEIMGKKGSDWFRQYLDNPNLRFMRMAADCVRPTDPDYAPVGGQTSLSDGYPFLLASTSSLEETNRRLKASSTSTSVKFTPITMERFRPNIVVATSGKAPFVEDTWTQIRFGQVVDASGNKTRTSIVMGVVKPCARCTIPNINPATGEMHPEREPSRTMINFRSGEAVGLTKPKWRKELFFGQNLDHAGQSGVIITTNSTVEVLSATSKFMK